MRYVITAANRSAKELLLKELAEHVVDPDTYSNYNFTCELTADQVNALKPRVLDIILHPEDDPKVAIGTCAVQPNSVFNRQQYVTNASWTNWGLLRCVNRTNPFSVVKQTITANYEYSLDGTGVDVIIVDTGVQPGHPEFAQQLDGTGPTRLVNYDWAALAARNGITGVPDGPSIGGYLGDSNGHGTNVASIACGSKQGWAKGAQIYTMRIFAGFDIATGQYLGAIPTDKFAQLVRAFHQEKVTAGNPRPTVVNCSWTYNTQLAEAPNQVVMASVNYRGTVYQPPLTAQGTPATTLFTQVGVVNSQIGIRVTSVEADMQSAITAGVVIVGAANNFSYKIDLPGGEDYDNYINTSQVSFGGIPGDPIYYHRGSTPGSTPGVITVGSVDSNMWFPSGEQKASYSSTGPRIDVFSPGTDIMAGYKNYLTGTFIGAQVDSRYQNIPPGITKYYIGKLTGTSQASPQVAGIAAMILQQNPQFSPAQVLNYITSTSTTGILVEQPTNTYNILGPYFGFPNYSNQSLLQGASNRYLFAPAASGVDGIISGGMIVGGSIS